MNISKYGFVIFITALFFCNITNNFAQTGCHQIDWETDCSSNPFPEGFYVTSDAYDCIGVTITNNNDPNVFPLVLFNSSAPTGGDTDLGTPSSNCLTCTGSCPGQSNDPNGGLTNCVDQGLTMITEENPSDTNNDGLEDNPDDHSQSDYTLTFGAPVTISTLDFIDDSMGDAIFTYSDNSTNTVTLLGGLDNDVYSQVFNESDVISMRIDLSTSGAISLVDFCYDIPGAPPCDLVASVLGADVDICEGDDPGPIEVVNPASGGNGTIMYQWQQSLVGCNGFGDIPGATSSTYNPGVLVQSTYFRVEVTTTNGSQVCVEESNCISYIEQAGCPSCTNPTVNVVAFSPTCVNSMPQSDGYLQISNIDVGDAYHWSLGNTFDDNSGTNTYSNATDISSANFPVQLATGQPNPTVSQDYTIRIYNGANDCFTDVVVAIGEQDCCGVPDVGPDQSTCSNTSGCLGGNAFEDFNCNGMEDAYESGVGVGGVQVIVYDCDNIPVDTIWTDSDGDWQACGLTDGDAYRVEFILPESIACWAAPTHSGTDNGTDVQFLTAPACTKFSLSSSADYCEEDPELLIACFVNGAYNHPALAGEVAIARITYSNSEDLDGNVNGTTTQANDPFSEPLIYTPAKPTPSLVAAYSDVGTVWGMVKSETQNKLYSASYIKSGTSLGPGESTGAIYVTENPGGTPSTTTYVDLNTIFGANTAGLNPHPVATTDFYWPNDTTTNIHIGKIGLGDMDITNDESLLYVVNLNDRMLYQIPTSGPLNSSTIQRFNIPTTGLPTVTDAGGTLGTCPPADVRPFATGVDKQGNVYVGGVCSCESISAGIDAQPNDASYQLTAYVWKFDGTNFTLVLDESLRFNRDPSWNNTTYNTYDSHIEAGGVFHRDWEPWSDLTVAYGTQPDQNEPMLSDIEFDDDGNMLLGFRDRSGDIQSIYGGFTSSGDIYKACSNGTGTWELENNASCDGTTTGGANNDQGPDGGEFYFEDIQGDNISNSGNGGLLVLTGKGEVISSATDAVYLDDNGNTIFAPNAAGIQIYDNTTGEIVGAYNFYEADQNYSVIKASGIGDVEACCTPAPIEIGNYVWCDSIQNGIQDACERGISDMIVQLYDAVGTLVGQDTTVNGNYYFNQYTVDTTGVTVDGNGVVTANTTWSGMNYNTQYFIVFGTGQFTAGEFTIGSDTYTGTTTANVNSNANDNVDSDVDGSNLTAGSLGARPDGLPYIDMMTEATGCGNHKYDMGIICGVEFDWGDLPDTGAGTSTGNYETQDANTGPSHQIIAGLNIGATVDEETDGQQSTDALGDAGDEDGFNFPNTLDIVPGGILNLPIDVVNTTGTTAHYEIWIDWNGDGDFNDPNEMVADLSDDGVGNFGQTYFTVNVPETATIDQLLGFRARLSHTDNMTPYGQVNAGEVEDYLIEITCKPEICLPVEITIKKD